MNDEGYILYVGNSCCSCNNIKRFLADNNIDIPSLNIDKDEIALPFPLLVVPALIKNKQLIAYGADIMKCLKMMKRN